MSKSRCRLTAVPSVTYITIGLTYGGKSSVKAQGAVRPNVAVTSVRVGAPVADPNAAVPGDLLLEACPGDIGILKADGPGWWAALFGADEPSFSASSGYIVDKEAASGHRFYFETDAKYPGLPGDKAEITVKLGNITSKVITVVRKNPSAMHELEIAAHSSIAIGIIDTALEKGSEALRKYQVGSSPREKLDSDEDDHTCVHFTRNISFTAPTAPLEIAVLVGFPDDKFAIYDEANKPTDSDFALFDEFWKSLDFPNDTDMLLVQQIWIADDLPSGVFIRGTGYGGVRGRKTAKNIVNNGATSTGLLKYRVFHELGHTAGLKHVMKPPPGGSGPFDYDIPDNIMFAGELVGGPIKNIYTSETAPQGYANPQNQPAMLQAGVSGW